ncbi:hypothetical protein BCV70DRAFT_183576 [Testicularia cyperi]|uniref:Acyltransferase MbtK/IucB-like conserved domain-containing protein n=1 Tax=Testicularia cyperi TaxID=1882483 RepID=A0A317XY25_9BASI|nr:hypothetical protein BCV70DRAFT_183576 [Testicularia cyperi]
MSALVHLASPATKKAPAVIQPATYPFSLPDGTKFTITVSHSSGKAAGATNAGSTASSDRVTHSIKLSTHKPHDWIDTVNTLTVLSPLAPFPNPASEPDDNTIATRSKRFATLSLVPATSEAASQQQQQQKKLWNWINVFFALWPSQEYANVTTDGLSADLVTYLTASRLASLHPSTPPTSSTPGAKTQLDQSSLLISRASFWQGSGSPTSSFSPWILPLADPATVTALVSSNHHTTTSPLAEPFKPSPSAGPLYSRFIPGLNSHLTFRIASSSNAKDVDLITEWHATDRVNEGWRQKLSRQEQIKTIQATENDPYAIGLIGEWDGEAWGYVEIYYSKHSNLKDFYSAGQFDRGFHALVGNEKFRGPHRVRSWMGSVVHLMFSLNPSTTLGVSEPRLSNTKMIQYEQMVGGNVEKYIDFNHKRAALVFFGKERFYQLCPMGPLPEHVS